MKKSILTFALMITSVCCAFAETTNNDTIQIASTKVEKVIVDDTVNAKGKTVKKYYLIYDGQLIPTSKTVVEHYNLAQKHGAKISLAMVVNKDTKRKRIVLN